MSPDSIWATRRSSSPLPSSAARRCSAHALARRSFPAHLVLPFLVVLLPIANPAAATGVLGGSPHIKKDSSRDVDRAQTDHHDSSEDDHHSSEDDGEQDSRLTRTVDSTLLVLRGGREDGCSSSEEDEPLDQAGGAASSSTSWRATAEKRTRRVSFATEVPEQLVYDALVLEDVPDDDDEEEALGGDSSSDESGEEKEDDCIMVSEGADRPAPAQGGSSSWSSWRFWGAPSKSDSEAHTGATRRDEAETVVPPGGPLQRVRCMFAQGGRRVLAAGVFFWTPRGRTTGSWWFPVAASCVAPPVLRINKSKALAQAAQVEKTTVKRRGKNKVVGGGDTAGTKAKESADSSRPGPAPVSSSKEASPTKRPTKTKKSSSLKISAAASRTPTSPKANVEGVGVGSTSGRGETRLRCGCPLRASGCRWRERMFCQGESSRGGASSSGVGMSGTTSKAAHKSSQTGAKRDRNKRGGGAASQGGGAQSRGTAATSSPSSRNNSSGAAGQSLADFCEEQAPVDLWEIAQRLKRPHRHFCYRYLLLYVGHAIVIFGSVFAGCFWNEVLNSFDKMDTRAARHKELCSSVWFSPSVREFAARAFVGVARRKNFLTSKLTGPQLGPGDGWTFPVSVKEHEDDFHRWFRPCEEGEWDGDNYEDSISR